MVMYTNEQTMFETDGNIQKIMQQCVEETMKNHGITDDVEVSVLFTDDAGIRKINSETRNIDKETDVLSFPQYETDVPGVIQKDNGYPLLVLGDVVLNLQRAEAQAQEYGHAFEREVGYLCVHSLLHLLGYDHMQEKDKQIMRKKEEEILQAIDLRR